MKSTRNLWLGLLLLLFINLLGSITPQITENEKIMPISSERFGEDGFITNFAVHMDSMNVDLDNDGNYEICVIPGEYDFYIERKGFLADITTKMTII